MQLGLYIELLELLGFEHANKGAVIDGHGNLVEYDLNQPMGKRTSQTYWDFYLQVKSNAALLIKGQAENKPALAGICKLCPWYTSCSKWVKDNSDPTELFYLGRAKRDVLAEDLGIFKTQDALTLDIESVLAQKKRDKTFLSGIGEATLRKIVDRARIMHETKLPVLYKKITFPNVSYELFFDIEDDPTREFVYLHGVYERHNGNERFIDFTAAELTPAAEKDAWQRFWNYIKTLPADDYAVYYYSPHEKTTYKNLQRLYPDVISESELEDFFANPNVIDLYNQVVLKYTDWPVSSYGLKALATYCGFSWRDETPSGALSIQWYNTYLETKDPKILERILLYNEDDCKATMVIKDYIKKM